ncbi:hypothetical protein WR25_10938 isoform B [Diploscapter pachys]|uniref:Death domain-containing protein n=1 Tax=Diploscapter pachys TaxID=2018661 RepID=A0A2A2K810_9BILA|nr:hypothetical protein WR25_10938 isoform B [Diploscapter pachys]
MSTRRLRLDTVRRTFCVCVRGIFKFLAPLHVASHFGQLNMVRWLIEHGADVNEKTQAAYTSLHQAAQQGHNNCVRYLLENGASPNAQNAYGQTPLSIAQRLGYVSVVETLKTVTETTVITETTVPQEERYKPQNPEAMNETMFSESEDEGAVAEHEAATAAAHAKDFSDNLTKGLADSTAVHMIHTGEQLLSRSAELEGKRLSTAATDGPDNLEELIRRAQAQPVTSASAIHESYLDHSTKDDNIPIGQHVAQPSKLQHKTFLISFLVDARGGAMRGCRHSGVRIIVPPRKASQPIRVTCRYLRKDKLAHPPPLSEGEELASRILEMAPAGAKFLGPVILEVPHFASLREREREIVILRSDDGQHWKEHQLEATEDAVQEVLNESFDAEELAQLDDLHTPRITRILTSDFPMYFAVVTRIRQEVHCVGPEGGVIISSVVPRVQAIFPDGSLTKTIKVSVQAQPVPHEMVTRLHGNRVAVSPIVTVEPRRRKFHKPITLCIPIPQSSNKQMLTQYSGQAGQEPPTLRLLCSITGGSAPAQWEDITGTTQLTFTGDEVSFTTTVSARFWLMDCQTPRDAARMAQEVYNEAIAIPYMAKFVVFARRTFPVEGQLRVFCMTDDKEDKTLEKQEHFKMIAKSRDVEVLKGKHQFLEFAGNLVPVTKSGDQLSLFFLPFQENRLAFMVKTRNKDDAEAATEGRIAFMKEPKIRSETLPPQQPICTLAISLPEYTGDIVYQQQVISQKDTTPFGDKYRGVLEKDLPGWVHPNVLKSVGADWPRLARALELPHSDIQYLRHHYSTKELPHVLRIWMHLKKEEADPDNLNSALHRIGREDIVRSVNRGDEPDFAYTPTSAGVITNGTAAPGSRNSIFLQEIVYAFLGLTDLKRDSPKLHPPAGVEFREKQQPSAVEIKEKHHVETREVHHPVVEEVIIPEPRQSLSKSRSKSPEPEPELIHEPTPPLREEEEIAPIPEQPEQEETVSEVRTVVRTERHVHDTEEGPIVEEKIITTTYEDDVAVNESVEVRTVALNEEEMNKWNELNQIVDQPGDDLKKVVDLPEGIEQEVKTERHVEDDGTVVTTVVTTSRYSDSPSSERADSAHEASKYEPSGEPPGGTTQKKETAEEGFTNEDGSVVVSKKMTRVVTTTRTTLPGDDSSSAPGDDDETRSRSEDEQSVKSVKDKIAMFEQQFAGDKPIKQYEYQKPDVYRDEDEEMMSSEPLMETSEVVREAMKVSGGSDEGQPQPGMATIADPTLSLGEAAISVASLAGSDIVRDDQERPESEPAKRTKYSTSHETTTTYSMSRKRLGEDGEELEDYEQTGSEIGEMPTPMTRSGHDVEEEPMIRAYASGVEPQTAPEAAPRRISATSTTSSTQIVHQEPQEGSDDDIEADTRIVTKEDGSLQGIEESKDEPEAEYQPMMRRTSSTEPTFTTYRHEQEPVEVREEIDVKMLPSGDTVITEKDTMIQHPIHESPRHSESHRSSDEEEEGPSRGEKALGFMKQAGKIAGAAVAAPVVLAGIGAAKAYDALTRDKSPESEQLEERRFEQESPVGGMKHEPTSETQFTETTTISPEPSETGQRERSSQSDAGDLESSDAGPRRTTLTETTTSYTLSRKHEGHPDEGNIEAETLDELHEHTEPEITESYTRKETFDEEGHPVIIETETHTERRRLSSMSEDKPSHETPQEQEFSRRVEHDLEGNTVITETSTTFIHHSPEEERRSLPESEKFEVSEQQRSGRSSPVVEEPEVEEITTVTKTTITQRPSITSSDLESAEVQRPIEEEPYPQESEFSRIEEIDPSGRTASITESITTRRTSDQEGSDSEHPAEEETIVTRKVEHEPTGDTIITETTTVSRTKRLSQSSEITDIVEPENVETIVQKPPEFTEEPEVEGEYKTEEIRTSTSIQRQPSGEMVVTETKTTTTVIHQPPQMEGDIEEAKEQSPEDDVHRQIGGATIKRSSEHENLSHIGLSGAEKETDIDADLHHHHPEPFSERTVSESHVEDIDKSEDMPRRMSEPDEHEKDLSVERESFDSSHIESPSKQHREGLREELSAPDFEAPQFKDEFRSDVSLPEPRRDSQISDESEGEEGPSRGEKALGFMKKAGKIAGAAIAAPAVLAGMGAMKAYEAIKGDASSTSTRDST